MGGHQVGTKEVNDYLQGCVDVFRDRVDYSVENSIPVGKAFRYAHPPTHQRQPDQSDTRG